MVFTNYKILNKLTEKIRSFVWEKGSKTKEQSLIFANDHIRIKLDNQYLQLESKILINPFNFLGVQEYLVKPSNSDDLKRRFFVEIFKPSYVLASQNFKSRPGDQSGTTSSMEGWKGWCSVSGIYTSWPYLSEGIYSYIVDILEDNKLKKDTEIHEEINKFFKKKNGFAREYYQNGDSYPFYSRFERKKNNTLKIQSSEDRMSFSGTSLGTFIKYNYEFNKGKGTTEFYGEETIRGFGGTIKTPEKLTPYLTRALFNYYKDVFQDKH